MYRESYQIVEATSDADFAAGKLLIEEYATALGVDLCFQNFSEELRSLAIVYGPPDGCLLLARKDEAFVGCVAIRGLGEITCEMKRLYVTPQYRGIGLGKNLTVAAIARAGQLDYTRMVLDTLTSMVEARYLYESLGFREIEAYYPNPLNGVRYFALDLHAT